MSATASGGDAIVVRAHAKLNVFLRVLARRADGYHDLQSLVLPVSLHDVVTVRAADALTLSVEGERAGAVPTNRDNLVLGAALALAEAAGVQRPGAAISIDKRIPVAAGMGGGSADAAAALRALNRLWECGLDAARLEEVAARVGSDVPALLDGDAVFVRGRGEWVEPVRMQATCWVVRPPSFGVSTADAFGWWDDAPNSGPDPGALIAAAETGNLELLASALYNDLQVPVSVRHPEIEAFARDFATAGALGSVMTGSGPTVVALARHRDDADRIANEVPGSFVTVGSVEGESLGGAGTA